MSHENIASQWIDSYVLEKSGKKIARYHVYFMYAKVLDHKMSFKMNSRL